jgi:hypothetical protein
MTVAECDHFKNKAEFVEVVRCKGCIKRGASDCPFVYYSDMFAENEDPTEDTDFCSHGERREE